MSQAKQAPELKRTLGSFQLWGIAVGLVISGEYFGWSYGWAQAGTLGFLFMKLSWRMKTTLIAWLALPLLTLVPQPL